MHNKTAVFYEPGRGQLYTDSPSHMYDRFLATSQYRGKNWKKNWTTSSDEGLW